MARHCALLNPPDAYRLARGEEAVDWSVRLGGDEWSLQGLSEALLTEPRVWKDNDGHDYLSSPTLSACLDENGAWREAELAVARVNDAAAALEPGYRPIVTQAPICVADNGSRCVSARAMPGTGADRAAERGRYGHYGEVCKGRQRRNMPQTSLERRWRK